jgi:hypothetical protein
MATRKDAFAKGEARKCRLQDGQLVLLSNGILAEARCVQASPPGAVHVLEYELHNATAVQQRGVTEWRLGHESKVIEVPLADVSTVINSRIAPDGIGILVFS